MADLDELTKLEAVGEDEINVLCRKGDIGRVGGVRDSEVEAMVRGEVETSEGRNNGCDLEESRGGRLVIGDHGGSHFLEELLKGSCS